ncbi:MAG: DUF3592 domain-containing protein [Allosphingosinicella sp.]
MNKNVKAALIVGAILALLAGYFVYISNERAKMTAAATGAVTKSEFVPDSESSSLDETRIEYRFEAGGTAFAGQDAIPGADRSADYPVGRTVEVCYNPDDPTSSRLNRGGPCG